MKQKGFTLVEIMVVVAILGIVAAIGYPAYQDYVVKAKRSDMQQHLLTLVAEQQRLSALNQPVTTTSIAPVITGFNANSDRLYDLAVVDLASLHFKATAIAGKSQAKDTAACKKLEVNRFGPTGSTQCWQ